MFEQLDQVVKDYMKEFTEASIEFQSYEEVHVMDEEDKEAIIITPFILVIVTEKEWNECIKL